MDMVNLLFSFEGRICRKLYWAGGVFVIVAAGAALIALVAPIAAALHNKAGLSAFGIASILAAIAVFLICGWSSIALQVKRLHDRGRSGYLALFMLVPILSCAQAFLSAVGQGRLLGDLESMPLDMLSMLINTAFAIDLGMLNGQPGANRYGAPPGTPGALRSPENAPSPTSLGAAEQAIARAIDAQSNPPHAAKPAAAPAARARPASAGPASFGRRASH